MWIALPLVPSVAAREDISSGKSSSSAFLPRPEVNILLPFRLAACARPRLNMGLINIAREREKER